MRGAMIFMDTAKVCFDIVRDEIKRSHDCQLHLITCRASNVPEYKPGYCYAKSHLLAVLLRTGKIMAGLVYQRLTIVNDTPSFCLHELNAVFPLDLGCYRLNARDKKADVEARSPHLLKNYRILLRILARPIFLMFMPKHYPS